LYPYGYGGGSYPYDYGYGSGTGPWAYPSTDYYPGEPPAPPQPTVALSGELPAVLTLEFPAPADVWLAGKKVEGAAANVRTVHSPALRPGDRYTFHVKAEWTAKGQTYEYNRDVTLEPGAQSRLLVISGTAVEAK
jgi:uncharacterized protein (TIGR03000 family)